MNNTDKLIASQYLVKQANIGALLGRLSGALGKGLSFVKNKPLQAGAAGAAGLGGLGLMDMSAAMAGNKPMLFDGMADSSLVKGFRGAVEKNPMMDGLMMMANPLYMSQRVLGKLNPSMRDMPDMTNIGTAGKYNGPRLGEAGIKRSYANYLNMGGDTYSPDPVIKGLATHNLGNNTSNITTNHLANTPVSAEPKATPAAAAPAAAPKNDMNALFKTYMGSAFDPNSSVDNAKMKYLQGLSDKGVTMNAANIYDKKQGYGKF